MSIIEEEYGFGLIRASISPGFRMAIIEGRQIHLSIISTTKNPKNTENPVSNTGQASGLFNPYVPLKPSADTLPALPIHCLPPRLQAYVAAVAEHTQTPVDMAGGVALGVLATCL